MPCAITPADGLPDVKILQPRVHGDDRGFFLEWFRREDFAEAGLPNAWAQANHSRSAAGVLRGLHFQFPRGQGKLVRCVRGRIFDVAVDVRAGSPTYGVWTGAWLDDVNHRLLYIPPDFAHGFAVPEGVADVVYFCTDIYTPEAEHTLAWDDPAVGVEWPLTDPAISPKDAAGKSLAELAASGRLPPYRGG